MRLFSCSLQEIIIRCTWPSSSCSNRCLNSRLSGVDSVQCHLGAISFFVLDEHGLCLSPSTTRCYSNKCLFILLSSSCSCSSFSNWDTVCNTLLKYVASFYIWHSSSNLMKYCRTFACTVNKRARCAGRPILKWFWKMKSKKACHDLIFLSCSLRHPFETLVFSRLPFWPCRTVPGLLLASYR